MKKAPCLFLVIISLLLLSNNAFSQTWWNTSYLYRQGINITNNHLNLDLSNDYSINISVDTLSLINTGKLQSNCKDLRIVFWNGSENIELDRVIENSCNLTNTLIWFNTYLNITPINSNHNYSMYFAAAAATNPPILDLIENFSALTIQSYGGNQDVDNSQYEILDSGRIIRMWGNNWKAITKNIEVNSDTVIDLDFKSNHSEGEIQGTGVDTDLTLSPNRHFHLYGTQNWGITTYDNYAPSDWKRYILELADEFTGSFSYLTFSNDADGNQDTNVLYKNVKIRKYISPEPSYVFQTEESYDISAPLITLNSPIANYNTTEINFSFNFTAVDNSQNMNCSIFLDGILNATNSSTSNNTNTIFNIKQLNAGHYSWYIRCVDELTNSNISDTRNFTIDLTGPTVNKMDISPSSIDNIDPNIQLEFTANVTDTVKVDSVKFQYKSYNLSDWINDTMAFNGSDIYINASFTPTYNGTWFYRIWSNDTLGNENSSSTQNVSVALDWTWKVSPLNLGAHSALLGNNVSLGNITINNTGDFSIGFDIFSDWQTVGGDEKVFFNDTEPFTLAAKEIKILKVNATVSETERSDDISISFDAINSSSSPSIQEVNATLVSYVSGPYLYTIISEFVNPVNQSTTGNILKAFVKNLGNETTIDVNLTWNLPTGWSSEFVLNEELGNISVGQQLWSNITADINADAPAGLQTLLINSTSSNSAASSHSVFVTIICSQTDDVCGAGCSVETDIDCTESAGTSESTSSGGGGGGGFGGSVAGSIGFIDEILTGEEILNSEETIEIFRGRGTTFPITVKNIFDETIMYDITLNINGYLDQYLSISPSQIDKIEAGTSEDFEIEVTSPEYMETLSHILNLIIKGTLIGSGLEKEFTENRKVTLIIHSTSKEEAYDFLILAKEAINLLELNGFPVDSLLRLIGEAEFAYEAHEYEFVEELGSRIIDLKNAAIDADKLINSIKEDMNKYVSITGAFTADSRYVETENLLNIAIAAFERGDYLEALQKARDARLVLAVEEGEFDFLVFIQKNSFFIAFSLIFLTILVPVGYVRYESYAITNKIHLLNIQEDVILDRFKSINLEYFKKKGIDSELLQEKDELTNRLSVIKAKRSKLRNKRVRILHKDKVRSDLNYEKSDVLLLLKKLQQKYYVQKSVDKKTYSSLENAYRERLAEIEEEIWTIIK